RDRRRHGTERFPVELHRQSAGAALRVARGALGMTSAAQAFHAATKYVMRPGAGNVEEIWLGTPPDIVPAIWEEDWSIEPLEFKIYETLAPIALPRSGMPTSISALEALAADDIGAAERVPDLAAVAQLAFAANGLLDRRLTSRSGRVFHYRTAGCT